MKGIKGIRMKTLMSILILITILILLSWYFVRQFDKRWEYKCRNVWTNTEEDYIKCMEGV
jgi:uncharacterized protein YxeA